MLFMIRIGGTLEERIPLRRLKLESATYREKRVRPAGSSLNWRPIPRGEFVPQAQALIGDLPKEASSARKPKLESATYPERSEFVPQVQT
jgi:hypothetical protein